jgi:hypothetical protein
MPVQIETDVHNINGYAVATSGQPVVERAIGQAVTAAPEPVTAPGRFVLAEDGETVKFLPVDQAQLDAVVAAAS